jgi:hypothetical protein
MRAGRQDMTRERAPWQTHLRRKHLSTDTWWIRIGEHMQWGILIEPKIHMIFSLDSYIRFENRLKHRDAYYKHNKVSTNMHVFYYFTFL